MIGYKALLMILTLIPGYKLRRAVKCANRSRNLLICVVRLLRLYAVYRTRIFDGCVNAAHPSAEVQHHANFRTASSLSIEH
ncbi:hypothetical protein PF008_g31168 [Phytophthora fragariae]|uniref:Secreted protein n=1 Tax=Phytophthora fragariae TaxID=53985 RepID=A0A6G0Q436_9STRA|nr:hypothetical protein PF008_g31168 [Phytophthora fragariae]